LHALFALLASRIMSTDPRPVVFGIVSPGRWGRKLLDAAKASPRLTFAGVFSRNPANATDIAGQYGGRVYPSYEAQLADTGIEAMLIPTPHFLHFSQTVSALRAGKHVFVEKPIATRITEAEEMLRTSEETGRVLAVGHQGRHTGGIRKVKEMLAAGELGEVAAVVIVQGFPHALFRQANDWRTGETAVPGGQLDELGVHYFDVLQFLFGPARRVTGFVQRPSPDAPPGTATAALHFDGGIIASYTTYATSVGLSRMTILASKGALELNRMGQDACTWQPVSDLATSRQGGLPPQPITFPGPYLVTTALTAELEDFASAIRERRRPQVGAAESLSTLRISRAVMEASSTGRTINL
jgi:predicted dehydrogenase